MCAGGFCACKAGKFVLITATAISSSSSSSTVVVDAVVDTPITLQAQDIEQALSEAKNLAGGKEYTLYHLVEGVYTPVTL